MGVLDGLQTVTSYYSTSTTTFTFTAPGAAPTVARTGNCILERFTGSYIVTTSGQLPPNDRRITLNTFRNHNLAVGDHLSLNFSNGNPLPVDGDFVVETVVDPDTLTVLGASANGLTNQQENTIYIFPHPPQNRAPSRLGWPQAAQASGVLGVPCSISRLIVAVIPPLMNASTTLW